MTCEADRSPPADAAVTAVGAGGPRDALTVARAAASAPTSARDTRDDRSDSRIYTQIFEIMPDAVLIHCCGAVTYANRAAADLWGAANLVGMSMSALVAEGLGDTVERIVREVAATNRAKALGGFRLRGIDGGEREVEGRCAPFAWFGEPAVITVIRDLSKLKQAEGALQARVRELESTKEMLERSSAEQAELNRQLRAAKEAADTANRTKSDFLANMSHELRTPLNAIMGFSEVMKNEMLGPVGLPQYVEYARDIFASGAHLLEIINDILDLSKVEAGGFELSEEQTDVADVIGAVLNLVKVRAEEKDLAVETRVAPGLPLLFADKRALKQMLLNLLSNAIKFTATGGAIGLSSWQAEDGGMRIAVRDSGIGIAGADVEKVLLPFGQVDSPLAREHQGTGLGLPLVKAMIEIHGGAMTLESEVGRGTTVLLAFPANRSLARAAAVAP